MIIKDLTYLSSNDDIMILSSQAGAMKNRQQICEKLNLKESDAPSHLPLLACCLNNSSKSSQSSNMVSSLVIQSHNLVMYQE